MEELIKAVEELQEKRVLGIIKERLAHGDDPFFLQQQMEAGMTRVGEKYAKGEYFIADLIMAGTIFKEAFNIPGMRSSPRQKTQTPKTGKILLGTVKGDLHDIGKNIFKDMAESAGFEVRDLGIDVPEDRFVNETGDYKPDIIGMSAVLTSAVDSIKSTVDALQEADLRKKVKILAGGLAMTRDVCTYVGADNFTNSAYEGVTICKMWRSR